MHRAHVYADIKHPTLKDFVDDAVTCSAVAATASVVAAVATENPGIGLAVFKPAWQVCMVAKAIKEVNKFEIVLGADHEYTCWSHHC